MQIQIPSLLRMKPGALRKIGKYLRSNGFDQVALLYGEGIQDLVGETLSVSLESSQIRVVAIHTVTGNAIESVVALAFQLPLRTQAVVAIGGGTALDVGKYTGFLSSLPVIAVPTAISNDGFASPGASLTVQGRRVSCPATMPFGVVVDTDVIASSPRALTYSGLGDLLAKCSSVEDWRMAYRTVGEPVSDFAVMITLQGVENVVHRIGQAIDDRELLQPLCGALVMSGIAMEVAGSSRPASGSEHLISHAYDTIAASPTLHGVQVAVATLATTWLQRNRWRDTVVTALDSTGVTGYLADHRMDRAAFVEAIRAAPQTKPGYYTCLSEPGAVEQLVGYVEQDPAWDRFLC